MKTLELTDGVEQNHQTRPCDVYLAARAVTLEGELGAEVIRFSDFIAPATCVVITKHASPYTHMIVVDTDTKILHKTLHDRRRYGYQNQLQPV